MAASDQTLSARNHSDDDAPNGRAAATAHVDPAELARVRERIKRITYLMDSAFQVPGTPFRFGLDPILGLLPGLGDLIALLPALYILYEAKRLNVSRSVRARMFANVLLDTFIGSVPLVGQAVDFVWKANVQNAKLMGIDLNDDFEPAKT